MLKCHRLQYSQFLSSYKLRLGITEEYKQQSSFIFTWCVRNTMESRNRDIKGSNWGYSCLMLEADLKCMFDYNPCGVPVHPHPMTALCHQAIRHFRDHSAKTTYFPLGLTFNRMNFMIWMTTMSGWRVLIWQQRRCLLLSQGSLSLWNHSYTIIQQTISCCISPECFAKGTH